MLRTSICLATILICYHPVYPTSQGTGWPLPEGYVVTSNHVVADVNGAKVFTIDGTELTAQVIVRDAVNDVALLKILDVKLLPQGLPLAKVAPKIGAEVFTIGFPHVNLLGKSPKFTNGSISSLSGLHDDPRFLQISVPVQAGNSGGPLLDSYGRVVGIITSKLNVVYGYQTTGDFAQNVNYALKAVYVAALISAIPVKGEKIPSIETGPGSIEELAERVTPSILLIVAESKSAGEMVLVKGGKFTMGSRTNGDAPP